jgi:hypothetical protein
MRNHVEFWGKPRLNERGTELRERLRTVSDRASTERTNANIVRQLFFSSARVTHLDVRRVKEATSLHLADPLDDSHSFASVIENGPPQFGTRKFS